MPSRGSDNAREKELALRSMDFPTTTKKREAPRFESQSKLKLKKSTNLHQKKRTQQASAPTTRDKDNWAHSMDRNPTST